jgi:hypothetical protein
MVVYFVLLHYFININITDSSHEEIFGLKEENGNFKIIYLYL